MSSKIDHDGINEAVATLFAALHGALPDGWMGAVSLHGDDLITVTVRHKDNPQSRREFHSVVWPKGSKESRVIRPGDVLAGARDYARTYDLYSPVVAPEPWAYYRDNQSGEYFRLRGEVVEASRKGIYFGQSTLSIRAVRRGIESKQLSPCDEPVVAPEPARPAETAAAPVAAANVDGDGWAYYAPAWCAGSATWRARGDKVELCLHGDRQGFRPSLTYDGEGFRRVVAKGEFFPCAPPADVTPAAPRAEVAVTVEYHDEWSSPLVAARAIACKLAPVAAAAGAEGTGKP